MFIIEYNETNRDSVLHELQNCFGPHYVKILYFKVMWPPEISAIIDDPI